MIHNILKDKPTKLFLGIIAFFCCNALIAETIGTKLFSLEKLFGYTPTPFTLFGESVTVTLTCGVMLWPLEFVMTDIVNEYYGPKAVRRISFTAIALISYAFLMFYAAIHVPAADFWITSGVERNNIPNMQDAFNGIFGQGMRIIVGSLVAFLVSQLVDSYVFHKIKRVTGEKRIWLRATGSTLVSQLVDSYIVLFIAFGGIFSWQQILAIGVVNYLYKASMAIILTPVIIVAEKRIEKYVGHDVAKKMKRSAMGQEQDAFPNIPTAG